MTNNSPQAQGRVSYAWGVAAGAFSALLLAFAFSHAGSPLVVLAYLAAVPLFMAGFGAGALPGLVAAAAGSVVLFALSSASNGAFYLMADAFPVTGLIFMALSARLTPDGKILWCPEGRLLTALVTYPCMIFLGAYTAALGHGGLLAMTADALSGLSDQIIKMVEDNGEKVTPDMLVELHHYLDVAARIAPALTMCAWIFFTLVAAVIAQAVLQQKKRNLRPAFTLVNLHVPGWVIYAAAVTGSVATFAPTPYDYIGLNLALVMGMPFFFDGLAVVHAAAVAQTRAPTVVLAVFYVVLSFVIYLTLLVALLGVVDQWVDFRKRFADANKTP